MDMKKYYGALEAMRMAHAAARTNGATQMSGLELARARVLKCEDDLSAAREVMRVAAKQAGLSGSYLFEFTEFVPRSTARRWVGEANAAGGEQRVYEIVRAFSQKPNPALRAWADRMLRRRRAAGIPDDVELTSDQSHALLCGGELVPADDDAEAEAQAEIEAGQDRGRGNPRRRGTSRCWRAVAAEAGPQGSENSQRRRKA
jgi:hypothetical protein